ncbi:MAG: hypothetical protein KC964_03500, partial [Candidatus Omnitrophica bacterium]|nr:hypothetical protein [Candidatus Omnitrophota bacterium]
MSQETYLFRLADSHESSRIYGNLDENLRLLEEEFDTVLSARGEQLRIQGSSEQVDQVRGVIEGMREIIRKNG